MPLPLLLGVGAVIAGAAGIGSGVHGAVKMKEANDTVKSAESRHKRNVARFEKQSAETNRDMDKLGELELSILKSFSDFAEVIERIHNRPEFKTFDTNGVQIPEYDPEKLKNVSIGAGVLIGGLGGAAVGTAGGFAAAGATTAAVMALGTASTGTAIASLSGVAATNATLAALGGGAIAAGGGGIALGTTMLGAATLGIGLLVGGVIFNITGSSISNKADEAWSQMLSAEKKIDKICKYLVELSSVAHRYYDILERVNAEYIIRLNRLWALVKYKYDWNVFSEEEKETTEITTKLVGLLYNMCKVKLVEKAESENEMNTINQEDVDVSILTAEQALQTI